MTISLGVVGLGLVASGRRNILPGHEFDSLYAKNELLGTNPIIGGDLSDTYDTLNHMATIVRDTLVDTKKVATKLQGRTLEQTLRNLWNHVYNHFQYKIDATGIEQIRRPSRSWMDRKEGIDCDCMTVVISSLLHHLNISHTFRKAEYNEQTGWQHVYVVVPKKGVSIDSFTGNKKVDRSKYYVLDCVVDKFDYEVPFNKKFDKVMKIQYLNGFDFATLNGGVTQNLALKSAENVYELLAGFGNEFNALNGLGAASPQAIQTAFMRGLKQHLINTRSIISINPGLTQGLYNPDLFLQRLTALIEVFDDAPRMAQVLGELVTLEEHEQLNGLGHATFGGFFNRVAKGIKSVATKAVDTGKTVVNKAADVVKTGATTVVNAAKVVGNEVADAAKKVARVIVRYNPGTALIRNGLLLAMKLNVFRIAEKLGYGYWSTSDALRNGLNLNEYNKNKAILEKARKIHKGLGGKLDKFDNAVKAGWKLGVKKHNLPGASTLTGLGATRTKQPTRKVDTKRLEAKNKQVKAALPLLALINQKLKPVNFKNIVAPKNTEVKVAGKNRKELDDFYQAIRTNKGGIATRLSLAYKPTNEAERYNKNEYAKLLDRVQAVEKLVVSKGGTAQELREVVVAGKQVRMAPARKAKALGEAVTISTAAAASILASLTALLTEVDFKTMFKGSADSPIPTPDEIRQANVTAPLDAEIDDEGDPTVSPVDLSVLLSEFTPTNAIVKKLTTSPTASLVQNLTSGKAKEVASTVTKSTASGLLSKITSSPQAQTLIKAPLAQALLQKVTPASVYADKLKTAPTESVVKNLNEEKAKEVAEVMTPREAQQIVTQITTQTPELVNTPLAQELIERAQEVAPPKRIAPSYSSYQEAEVVESTINTPEKADGKSNVVKYVAIAGGSLLGLYLLSKALAKPKTAPVAAQPAAEQAQPVVVAQAQPQAQPVVVMAAQPMAGVKRKSKKSQRTHKVMAITI